MANRFVIYRLNQLWRLKWYWFNSKLSRLLQHTQIWVSTSHTKMLTRHYIKHGGFLQHRPAGSWSKLMLRYLSEVLCVSLSKSELEIRATQTERERESKRRRKRLSATSRSIVPSTEWHTISSYPDTNPSLFVPRGQTSSNRGKGGGGGDGGAQSGERNLWMEGWRGKKKEMAETDLHRLVKRDGGKRDSLAWQDVSLFRKGGEAGG